MTFAYNADGLRVKIENSGGISKMIWDGRQYLAETDDAGATTALYTNEPDAFTNLISQERSGTTSWFHFDALGSTRRVTDSTEAITDTFLYDAWGNQRNRTGTTRIVFRWVGQSGYYHDVDTGTLYVIERVYDPKIARWYSIDALLSVKNLNGFSYSNNNPLAQFDPTGEAPIPCQGAPATSVFVDRQGVFSGQLFRTNTTSGRLGNFLMSDLSLSWKPRSAEQFEPDCCCCDTVGFVQIARNKSISNSWIYDLAHNTDWTVDSSGIFYPYHIQWNNPCGPNWNTPAIMSDRPRMRNILPALVVQYAAQEFETCVVCRTGDEGIVFGYTPVTIGPPGPGVPPVTIYSPYVRAMTIYGCVKWSHEYTMHNLLSPSTDERRLILGSDFDTIIGSGFASANITGYPGNAPTNDFINTVTGHDL